MLSLFVINKKTHPTGIEPTHMAPEAIALSTELRVHQLSYYNYPKKASTDTKKCMSI